MDREKVIKGVEHCFHGQECCGDTECPYYIEPLSDYCLEDCQENLKADALALLKEQETKLICNLLGGQPYEVYCRECRTMLCILGKGETMNDVKSIFSYCPHCGKRVKWE